MAPCHYLNQCWNIIDWTIRNKLQWNFDQNSYIFIQENAFENVVCEMAAILSLPQCVKYINALAGIEYRADSKLEKDTPYLTYLCELQYVFCQCVWENLPCFDSCPPGQYSCHFVDTIFRCIFMNEKFCILIKISLKFVLKVQLTITQHW